MSLVTFTKTSLHKHAGASRVGKGHEGHQSGIPTAQNWIVSGPFDSPLANAMRAGGLRQGIDGISAPPINAGFSINGGTRSVGGVGRDMKNSRRGTPFKGIHPVGYGGRAGTYKQATPLLNAGFVQIAIRGAQYKFVKPSVISARGQMHRRNRCGSGGEGGQGTNVVQPIFTGNLTDNASEGLFIQRLVAAHHCRNQSNLANVADVQKGCTGRAANTADSGERTRSCATKRKSMRTGGDYAKTLRQPMSSSEQTVRVGRTCGLAGASIPVYPGPMGVSGGCYSRWD